MEPAHPPGQRRRRAAAGDLGRQRDPQRGAGDARVESGLMRQRLQIGADRPAAGDEHQRADQRDPAAERRRPGDRLAGVEVGEPARSDQRRGQADHGADRDGDEAAVGAPFAA